MPNPTSDQLLQELASPQYTNQTPGAQATLLNASNLTYDVVVETWVVHNFLLASGIYGNLLDAYHNNANAQVRTVAEEAIDTVMGQIPQLDLNANSTIVQGMTALEGAGVLTAGDASSIAALGQRTQSRAEQLWGTGTVISAAQINAAGLAPKAGRLRTLIANLNADLGSLEMGTDVDLSAVGIN